MLFNSVNFILFFPMVLHGYFVLPSKVKNSWLLIVSYYFYMCWNAKYALLILFSTVITYGSGLLLQRVMDETPKKTRIKKWIVATCCLINLGILFYFKYTNFLLKLLSDGLALFGISLQVKVFDILLPVEISFYTFQALGYTVDVYRGEIRAEKNHIQYALFVSFSPQLVAGPIERSGNLLSQLKTPKKLSFENLK